MSKLMLVIIIVCLTFSVVTLYDGYLSHQRSIKYEEELGQSYNLNLLLVERLKLSQELLDLSLEMQKLIQEEPQDKKRMSEIGLEQYKLNQEILELGEKILSCFED